MGGVRIGTRDVVARGKEEDRKSSSDDDDDDDDNCFEK